MLMLLVSALLAAALGSTIVVLAIAILAANRSRSQPQDPAAAHAGDHRTIT